MSIRKLELELRHELRDSMKGFWELTWHEDREVSPGVPDVSFVMRGPGVEYETGWLELKADSPKAKNPNFTPEPSQHEWMARHAHLVPVYFLCSHGIYCYLIAGIYHGFLASALTQQQLDELPRATFLRKHMRDVLPPLLRSFTKIKRI